MSGWRASLRDWAPPALLRIYRRSHPRSIRFSGDFASWQEAKAASQGYDDASIVERVRRATQQARAGVGLIERDGVVLADGERNFPLLAALQHVALARGRLRVLDLGGALGGTYDQVRKQLPAELSLDWTVVEQPDYVACGARHFAGAELHFEASLEQALAQAPDVVLLSSVLPYLQEPRAALAGIVAAGCPYIIFDRTPVLRDPVGRDRLTVQHVNLPEYSASYPAWFFAEASLLEAFRPGYAPVFRFDSFESWDLGDLKSQSIGGLFRNGQACNQ
jgi:putative methyltransferase (TIGR04325 family)